MVRAAKQKTRYPVHHGINRVPDALKPLDGNFCAQVASLKGIANNRRYLNLRLGAFGFAVFADRLPRLGQIHHGRLRGEIVS